MAKHLFLTKTMAHLSRHAIINMSHQNIESGESLSQKKKTLNYGIF